MDDDAQPIGDVVEWQGRPLRVTWLPFPFVPPRDATRQASGLCYTDDGTIVLVTSDNIEWQLPGGKPETAESIEAAFAREVREEASAKVERSRYLGCQRVDDGPDRYYQARFWARVTLDTFTVNDETIARDPVAPAEFLDRLAWGASPIARALFVAAGAAESDDRSA